MDIFSNLIVGDTAKIVSLDACTRTYRDKLIPLGFTENTYFEVLSVAPLGDPVQVLIRGAVVSLRKAEADHIEIERVERNA